MELENKNDLPVFAADGMRAILHGATLLIMVSAWLIMYNCFKSKEYTFGLTCFAILFAVHRLLLYFAQLGKPIGNLADLDKEYTDVRYYRQFHILFLLALWMGAFVVTLGLTYYNATIYDSRYPHAEEVLRTEYHVSDKTLLVARGLPSYIVEDIYSAAEAVYLTKDLDPEKDAIEIEKVSDEIRDTHRKLMFQTFYALVFTFVFGLTFTLSVRSKEYNAIKKGLKHGNINVS